MESIINQIKTLADGANDHLRLQLIKTLRDLSTSLEKRDDSVQRIMNTPLELAGARIGTDLKIFERLTTSNSPLHLMTLATDTGADPALLGRLLRYLSSMKMIEETDVDTFAANNVSRSLATLRGKNHIDVYYEIMSQVYLEIPKFLAKTDYATPTDPAETAFQDAFDYEKKTFFSWWGAHPEKGELLNKHMELRRLDMADWMLSFPINKQSEGWRADKPVFVDIGGGLGHQCTRLKARYPSLPGRVILEDLPQVIERAPLIPGIEQLAYNAFEPQPIKDAKFYYFRKVLHDFPDHKCIEMIRNTAAAMGPDSFLLLDEMVLPDRDVHWQATSMDWLMLGLLAAQERTLAQWTRMLDSCAMKIADIHVYAPGVYESLIIAAKNS